MQDPTQSNTRDRPYAACLDLLRETGLRPTRQRLALAHHLFSDCDYRHVTAEELHDDVTKAGVRLSLATVYNTLHQFCEAGLLRELVVEPGRTHYDTNTQPHHHFYYRGTGRLEDIPADSVSISGLPRAPDGSRVVDARLVVMLEEEAHSDTSPDNYGE